ncbi:YraN family protein [Mangrovimonas aestuarii]|uniref:YraN family protein n=1 Tax=Mangrovimonas aestuarii TaxID=3018443 RepID=UPI0023797A63|nr:YraN family protein [Mangrovimonas aestuarii]
MAEHNDLGKKGEQMAVDFLVDKGYSILERNYRYLKAEIDIIIQKDEVVCAVEVKTRSTSDFGNPQDFVKPKQIKLLVEALNHYILENDLDVEGRFDIIAILNNKKGTQIEHLEDAFFHF